MLGTRFANVFHFREYDYSLKNESSQFHLYGDGWFSPTHNYYIKGNGYSYSLKEDVDVNCIYEIK